MDTQEFATALEQKRQEAIEERYGAPAEEAAPEGGEEGSVDQSVDAVEDGAIGDTGQEVGLSPEAAPPAEEEPTEEEAREAAAEALGEEASEEEREAAREQASEEFYVGRYKTREEAEKALEEGRLTVDRLHSERANWERERSTLVKQIEANQRAEEESRQLDIPAWNEWAAEAVEEGEGASGALAALSNGGYPGYEIYLKAWMGSEDPDVRGEALAFNNQLMLEVSDLRAQRVVAEREAAQPAQSEAELALEARRAILARRPDFAEYEDAMNEVLDEMPEGDTVRNYLKALAQGGVHGKERVLDHLYLEAKARSQGKTREARKAEGERRIASSQAAKVAASVSSAEATVARTPRTEAERAVIAKKNDLRERWGLAPIEE